MLNQTSDKAQLLILWKQFIAYSFMITGGILLVGLWAGFETGGSTNLTIGKTGMTLSFPDSCVDSPPHNSPLLPTGQASLEKALSDEVSNQRYWWSFCQKTQTDEMI